MKEMRKKAMLFAALIAATGFVCASAACTERQNNSLSLGGDSSTSQSTSSTGESASSSDKIFHSSEGLELKLNSDENSYKVTGRL